MVVPRQVYKIVRKYILLEVNKSIEDVHQCLEKLNTPVKGSGVIELKPEISIQAPPGNCGPHLRIRPFLWTTVFAKTAGQLQLYCSSV